MKTFNKTLIAIICLFSPLILGQDQDNRAAAIEAASKIPIMNDGRVKPLSTFAQVNLLAIHGKRSLKKTSATEWLLDALFDPGKAQELDIFDIRNDKVADALGLEIKKAHKYSFNEVWPQMRKNMELLRSAFNKAKEDRDLVESQLLEVYGNISRYLEIAEAVTFVQPVFSVTNPELAQAFGLKSGEKQSFLYFNKKKDVFAEYLKQMQAKSEDEFDQKDLEIVHIAQGLDQARKQAASEVFKVIPPDKDVTDQVWHTPWEVLKDSNSTPDQVAMVAIWQNLYEAYMANKPLDQSALDKVFGSFYENHPEVSKKIISLEVWKNKANLFYKSLAFYLLGFLLVIISWAAYEKLLRRLSFWSLVIGMGFHAAGIILRIIIMGRPPVSTLYESIIFVGFISVFSAIIYELMKKNGLGIFTGVTIGSILHFIGFSYAADGDTMGMLVAVLNSNFWLGTHVVTISIGYGCAFVAGFVGHLYLFFKIFKPNAKERLLTLSKNMVGTSLVALFFTLFGTILGGIWADQSWGRFWGWDPKENGALLIVLWFLVLLHGRIAGLLKDNGFAFGLVINNIIVALAWFGVNLLNVGLHSYGFTESIAFNLLMFCGAEALIGAVAYLWAKFKTA